jgi:fatty-acid desaturase
MLLADQFLNACYYKLSLDFSEIFLVSKLAHHIGNRVFDVREHSSEMYLKGVVFAVGLLEVVVRDLCRYQS